MDRFGGHVLGNRHNIQAELGLAAHGVHVGEGVGGGNLTEEIGVVRNGGEEIHRLDQGQAIGNLIDRGVVAPVKAHQQVRVLVDLDAL